MRKTATLALILFIFLCAGCNPSGPTPEEQIRINELKSEQESTSKEILVAQQKYRKIVRRFTTCTISSSHRNTKN